MDVYIAFYQMIWQIAVLILTLSSFYVFITYIKWQWVGEDYAYDRGSVPVVLHSETSDHLFGLDICLRLERCCGMS